MKLAFLGEIYIFYLIFSWQQQVSLSIEGVSLSEVNDSEKWSFNK